MTRLALVPAALAACLALTGCKDKSTNGKPGSTGTEPPVEIGTPFPAEPYPPAKTGERPADPIIVPLATVVIRDKSEVSATVDGRVVFVGSAVPGAEAMRLRDNEVWSSPRDLNVEKIWYRRLIPGRWVKAGEPIVFLDDDQAYIDLTGAKAKYEAAVKVAEAYADTLTSLTKILDQEADGVRRQVVPLQEFYSQQATQARYRAELTEREGAVKTSKADVDKAQTILDRHTVKAPITGEVQVVHKQKGDGVKAQEPILVIHNFDRLRVSGMLPKEYLKIVRQGDQVTIEVRGDEARGTPLDLH